MKNLLLFPIHDDDNNAEPTAKLKKTTKTETNVRKQNATKSRELSGSSSAVPAPQLPFEGGNKATFNPSSVIQNRLIRASAGTGKTYRLTSRYLKLLLEGATPESILATTFTRKAAGEILDRVVVWLAKAAVDQQELAGLARAVELPYLSPEDCRRKLSMLTRQMHRLRIYTLDAFFMQMALSFSLELGMTPGWQVLEEGGPESNGLRNEAIANVLRQESLDDLLVLLHQLTPKGEAKRGLDGMLKGRVNEAYRLFLDSSSEAWSMLEVPPPLPTEELDEIVRQLSQLPLKNKQIPNARDADVDRIVNENWQGFFNGGASLAKSINEGKAKYGNAKIPEELIAIYLRFLPHLRSKILQSASAQTRGTHDFLAKYHEQYQRLKEGQRLYGFDEVTRMLADHSQSNDVSPITFRMDAGIDHLLLDEFQDTSIPQWHGLLPLAKRGTSGAAGRSFFCVGDIKQAIYGWRGGSSEIFDLLDQNLPNLVNSNLKESRRSSPVIIDAVNRVFEFLPQWDDKKLGRAKRAASHWEFEAHTTFQQQLPGHFTIEVAGEGSYLKDDQEAQVFRRAAERVADISRQALGRSIGILCRRNSKVGQIMNELQRLGIPASEEGGNHLTDSAAVELILSLLHLTDHPTDSVTAYHLATSPWAKKLDLRVKAVQVDASVGDGQAATAAPKSDAPFPPGGIDSRAINTLVRRVRRQLLDDGYGNTVQGWANDLREFCNRRESRRLSQLCEKAYEYQSRIESPTQFGYDRQRRQSIRPTEFVRFIRETKVADPSNDTIRVMTVHQAKGLEFDIVVLPDLLGPFVEGQDTFLFRRESIDSDIDLICRYMGKDSGRSFLPDKFLPLFDQFEDRRASESFCVLYVAMTRAVHALHIFLPSGMQIMKGSKGHAGYLIKDAFVPGEKLEPDTTLYEAGDKQWFVQDPVAKLVDQAESIVPKPTLASRPHAMRNLETISPSQIGTSRYVRIREKHDRSSDQSRDYGLLIHTWLREITWLSKKEDIPNDDRLREVAIPYQDKIDVHDATVQFKELLVNEPLTTMLSQARYIGDLRARAPALPSSIELEVRNEQRVAGRDHSCVITGVVDRLVLIRSGGLLVGADIVDYKTDFIGAPSADVRMQKEELYRPQIEAYRRVLASSLRLNIESISSRLVFI